MKKVPLKYSPSPGTSIDFAVRYALNLARVKNRPVHFIFNDIKMKAHKRLSEKHLAGQWRDRLSASSVRYWSSSEGLAYKKQRAEEIEEKQLRIDTLMRTLPTLKRNLNHLMIWLQEFTEVADDVGVRFSPSNVIAELESEGYIANQHVGHVEQWFDSRIRVGQWLVGQALACLHKGMPPHPVASRFIDQYFALPEEIV